MTTQNGESPEKVSDDFLAFMRNLIVIIEAGKNATWAHTMLMAQIAATYKLQPQDSFDSETGIITRSPRPESLLHGAIRKSPVGGDNAEVSDEVREEVEWQHPGADGSSRAASDTSRE